MSSEWKEIINVPHFNKQRQLSSRLSMSIKQGVDGIFFRVSDAKGEGTTILLNVSEVSYLVNVMKKWIETNIKI